MKIHATGVAVALALAASACSARSPLERLFADLEARIEDRDAAGVVAHLAPQFQAENGMRPTGVAEELRRYFFAYESLDVMFSETVPEGDPPAKVSVRVDMSGNPKQVGPLAGLAPALAAYRFDLDLVAQDGRLLVSGARWERVDKVTQ